MRTTSNGQHGGYRRPQNPAPASGPGRLSRRTDGAPGQKLEAPTGMPYGDHQALMAQERTSAMSQSPSVAPAQIPAPQEGPAGAPPELPPLGAPTDRPDEPVTHGVAIGPGGGPEALMPGPMQPSAAAGTGQMTALLQRLSAADTTGILGQLMTAAQSRNA